MRLDVGLAHKPVSGHPRVGDQTSEVQVKQGTMLLHDSTINDDRVEISRVSDQSESARCIGDRGKVHVIAANEDDIG